MDVVAATSPTTASHELVPQLRFPPGFRFVPTEEELVDVYLRAKIEGRQLPLHVVNDVSILDWQPGRLVEAYKGYGEHRWFFFTVREQSSSNKEKEPSRKVKVPGVTATWKATGSVQAIRRRARSKDDGDGDDNKVKVGSKRVLIYNSSDAEENGKWSMHEYILQGHDQIGQYALYSIQRKQHSDTDDNAGNDDMDPEKKKKKTRKRKRAETQTPSTELEGAKLTHPETSTTTLLAEPPLKPTGKAMAQRKKKPSMMQVGVEREQQQQGQSAMEPVTPPKKDELVPTSQQELRQQLAAADGAPAPVVLSPVPLQVVRVFPPSEPGGTPGGAPAPTHEEDTLDDDDDDLSQLRALLSNQYNHPAMLCNNQGQEQWPWPPIFAGTAAFLGAPDTNNYSVIDHAPFQPYLHQEEDGYSLSGVQNQHLSFGENQNVYMEQPWQNPDLMFLMENTTQPMNSRGGAWGWEHGEDQLHQIHHQQQQQQQQQQQNNGGGFGVVVEDQQPMPMNHPQGGHDLTPSDEQSSGSGDLVGNLFGDSQMDELEASLRDLAAAGTQEEGGGDDPAATLQAAAGTQGQWVDDAASLQSLPHDDLQRLYYWQVQQARNEWW